MDVFVINLDRHAARLDWMKRGLGAAGVAFERIRATDGNRLPQDWIDRLNAGHDYVLSRYDVALILSHRKSWRRFLRGGRPCALILEDDVHLGRDFAALLAQLETGSIPFDLVKLETVKARTLVAAGEVWHAGGRAFHPLHARHHGTAGYVLNRKAAAILLRATRSLAFPIDWYLFDQPYLDRNGLAVLQAIPAAVAQIEFHNPDLANGELASAMPARGRRRSDPKPAGLGKLAREAVRPLRQLAAAIGRFRKAHAIPGGRWLRVDFE
jgi:glycosyl transferase, family 25